MSNLDSVEAMFGAGDSIASSSHPDYAAMEEAAFGTGDERVKNLTGVGEAGEVVYHDPSSSFLKKWANEAISPVLAMLTQAALRPGHDSVAPMAPGHGISANPAGVMKPFEEVEKMAGDSPLQGLNQWSHLF